MQTGPLLEEAYLATGKVPQIYRHYPLPQLGHTHAIAASKASYCAGQQDPKYFWGMVDWLFANQNTWAPTADTPISSASRRFPSAWMVANSTGL